MKILFVGSGGGSFAMRGKQIAAALGGRTVADPYADDFAWADLVVLVKRAIDAHGAAAKASGKPIIWDVLDYWTQPDDNATALGVLQERIAAKKQRYGVKTLIGATRAMADAIGGVYIPHHCWTGLVPTPPRDTVTTVAYDGSARYLGTWKAHLDVVCASQGLRFVVNPQDLSKVDVLVAFRDGKWDGPVCRAWKSGVKYVNAICAGRPMLTHTCAAHDEIAPVGMTIEHPSQLDEALAFMCSTEQREMAYAAGVQRASWFTVKSIADQYRHVLQQQRERAA